MVKIASEVAAKDGWEIKNVAVTDNVAYNDMVQNGEADANFAQHKPFMEQYTEEKNADLAWSDSEFCGHSGDSLSMDEQHEWRRSGKLILFEQ